MLSLIIIDNLAKKNRPGLHSSGADLPASAPRPLFLLLFDVHLRKLLMFCCSEAIEELPTSFYLYTSRVLVACYSLLVITFQLVCFLCQQK